MKTLVFGKRLNIEAAGMEEVNGGGPDVADIATVEAVLEDPKNCFDGSSVARHFLSLIDWAKAETRGQENGPGREYKTTTAHNITLADDKFTYQFGLSCNRKPKKSATPQGMTASESRKIEEAKKIMTQVAKRTGKSVEDIALDALGGLK
jgi:hypothetical protein